MRAVVTRVSEATVTVDGGLVGKIGSGLMLLVGATHSDTPAVAEALAAKVANLRILRGGDRDDFSALDVSAPVLVVSQFTLYADTRRGRRPGWTDAAPGPVAEPLVEHFVLALRRLGLRVETGQFGAMMQVMSVNDGPFTVLLELP